MVQIPKRNHVIEARLFGLLGEEIHFDYNKVLEADEKAKNISKKSLRIWKDRVRKWTDEGGIQDELDVSPTSSPSLNNRKEE